MKTDAELSRDEVFDILSNSRRRYMIYHLVRQGGDATLSELADQITAWENETTVERIGNDQRRRVYISLYQTHLPKLVDHDIVSYDEEEKTVALTDNVGDLIFYLRIEREEPTPWTAYHVAFCVVSVAFLLGVWGGLFPISLGAAAVVVAIAFVALTAARYGLDRARAPRLPGLDRGEESRER